jgi:TonB family protein
MKPILLVLIYVFLGVSTLVAQENSAQVQAELNQIKSQEGTLSFAYVEKLIALAQAYQTEKAFAKALGLDKDITTSIKRLSKKAPKEAPPTFDQQIEDLQLKQVYTYWQGLMLQEGYAEAQTFLIDNNWIKRCVYNKNKALLLQFFELAHQKISSEHLNYLNNWEVAYLLYASNKYHNEEQCEQMWQAINKHRVAEGEAYSPKHLEVLFGYASFCKRTGKTSLYESLKTKVEKHWPFAFKTPITKIDNPNTNVSPSKTLKENAGKSTPPSPPPPPLGADDEMPRFPGCEALKEGAKAKKTCADQLLLKFIYSNLEYPSTPENGIESMAVVGFTVSQYGTITEVKLIRNPGGALGKEALKRVQLMSELPRRWNPGTKQGKPLATKCNLPIRFKLH